MSDSAYSDEWWAHYVSERDSWLSKNAPPPDKVVCAALRHGDTIVCGARHFDYVMHSQLRMMPDRPKHYEWEQGFIDNFGRFLTREEAAEIVGRPGHSLCSEDLY